MAPFGNLPTIPRITSAELERVIQRAAELQLTQGHLPDSLEEADVIRIAEEVGLEPRHVRQALAELRAEALVPLLKEEKGVASRLFGEPTMRASRVVPGTPDEILSTLSEYLAERESLTCVRDRGRQQVWEPAKGLGRVLQRSLDFSGRKYELAKARRTGVFVEPLEEGRSLVTLTVDLTNERNTHAGAWMGGLSAGVVGPSLGLILGAEMAPLFVVPVAVGLVSTIGPFLSTKTFGAQKARTELAVQGLLDRLERGSGLASDRPSLRKRIEELFEEDE